MSYTVHSTAIIDDGAQIGEGSRIWHWVHVCGGAQIGEGCSLGQNVFVGNKVVFGDNCKIQNNVSVYDNVTLEEGVFCGPSMVFTNVYNPRALIERKNEYRNTLVRRGVTIGANATIVCGVTIGKYAFIGAGALINKDVPAYALMVGVPARQTGWMSQYGERLDLPLIGNHEVTCPYTGDRYRLDGDNLLLVDVPNEQVLPSDSVLYDEPDAYALDMKKDLDAIRNAALPLDADLPSMSEKQIERFEAFKLREDR